MFNSSSWNPTELANAKVEFHNYKAKLRPLIAAANLYHVLPRPTGTTWDGVQYHDPSTGNGAIYVFRPNATEGSITIALKGLDKSTSYRLDAQDHGVPAGTVLSGQHLMSIGVAVAIPDIYCSDLIWISPQQ